VAGKMALDTGVSELVVIAATGSNHGLPFFFCHQLIGYYAVPIKGFKCDILTVGLVFVILLGRERCMPGLMMLQASNIINQMFMGLLISRVLEQSRQNLRVEKV